MNSQEALLVLNAIPGFSVSVLFKLIKVFGSPQELFKQDALVLLEQGLNSKLVNNILYFPKDKFLEAEYNLVQQKGVKVITILDEDYPVLLKEINFSPTVLYIKGDSSLLNSTAIALVGARKATYYGLKIAQEFSKNLAQAGITVVSGLAYGIDTVSHKASLEIKGKTIAVLGSGLNQIYPKENTDLFIRIAQEGVLVSEFPMNTEPLDYNFPRRNRIVSGLSLATIVVEAAAKSGALITADYAIQQQREVFVVPGNIDSVYSQGTNRLIKEGAKIALSVQEVLEELGLEIKKQLEQEYLQDKPHIQLSVEEYKIYEIITHQPCHVDDIALRLDQEISFLMGQMVNLELKGVIKQLPGQFYVRV